MKPVRTIMLASAALVLSSALVHAGPIAQITGTYTDGCRDFAAAPSKDISHVVLQYADALAVLPALHLEHWRRVLLVPRRRARRRAHDLRRPGGAADRHGLPGPRPATGRGGARVRRDGLLVHLLPRDPDGHRLGGRSDSDSLDIAFYDLTPD